MIENSAVTDILEMDAASNNSVENIRDIRDEVVYTPAALKYRVYIIDEVHMLSGSAFNALLKTLEEPPAHVIFILATTELHKLPSTIISRCQRFDFRRIAIPELMKRIMQIAKAEEIDLDEEAAFLIAKLAQGGMRDSISLLELCAGSHERITVDLVNDTVGSTGRSAILGVVRAIAAQDYETILQEIHQVVQSSRDIRVFWQDLISLYRDLLVVRTSANASEYLDLTENELHELREAAKLFTKETLLHHSRLLEEGLNAMQRSADIRRITAEFTLLRMCEPSLSTSADSLLSRISELERTVAMLQRSGVRMQSGESPSADAPSDSASTAEREKAKAVPASESLQKTAAVQKPESVSRETNAQAETEKRVFKALRGWADIIERLTGIHPMYKAMLGDVKAYTSPDGTVLLRFPNSFTLMNFEQFGSRDQLRGELSYLLKRDVKDKDLKIEIATQGNTSGQSDLFEELIESAEDLH
jgi:DNA polymerase-3 subunit gamma/tau